MSASATRGGHKKSRKSVRRDASNLNTFCRHCFVILVYGQVTIIFVVSVGLSVSLFVCAEFFSAVFDLISIKLGHILYVWV